MLDAEGRPLQQQVGNLTPTQHAYDNDGRLNGIAQGSRVSTTSYDTDPAGPSGSDLCNHPTPLGYAAQVLAANPIGFWRLGDSSGATFAPALDAISGALDAAGPSLWPALLHLAAITLAYGALARLALRRFA